MEDDTRLAMLFEQLTQLLEQYPRIDDKISVVIGGTLGMAALLILNIPPFSGFNAWMALGALITAAAMSGSFWHSHKALFPRFEKGNQSLIFFREIAARSEYDFIDQHLAQDRTRLAKDVLGQIWRNSRIITYKFDHLKQAFYYMAWSVIPWMVTLILCASHNAALVIH